MGHLHIQKFTPLNAYIGLAPAIGEAAALALGRDLTVAAQIPDHLPQYLTGVDTLQKS